MHIILLENDDLNLFNNAHHFLVNSDFSLSTSNSFLEILIGNDIYTITDENQIKNYRKTGIIPNNEYIKKYATTIVSENNNTDYDYPISINEIKIEEIEDFENTITDEVKQFQMKKELIYKNKSNIYYKCEIITTSNQHDVFFKNISLNTKNPKYVYSIVSDKKLDEEYYIRQLHFMLDSNILPLKKTHQQSILKDYMNLIRSVFSSNAKLDNNIAMFAPKPATLEKHNLASIKESYGITVSIFENYAVTEKADGLRFLLYINDESKAFLIETSSKQVRGCNITTELKNCLLDGELVLCQDRLLNNSKDLFAIFDIYYYNNKKITQLPLLDDSRESRYNYMNQFVSFISNSSSHDIIVKKQLTSNDILKNCDEILSNKDSYDYHIDGLIFTPTKIPVLAAYANKPVEVDNINNLSWNKVLKWKPPDENTIDFIVIEQGKHKLETDGKVYKEYSLNVVFNSMDMEPISIANGIQYMFNTKNRIVDKNVYSLRQFTVDDIPQSVYIEAVNNKCFTSKNEEILNNSVVEFAYDNSILMSNKKRWKPLRIRHDKNKIYNFGKGELNKTANSYFVAMNIWRSITNEVSTDMISGKQDFDVNIKTYLTGLDVYYKRSISSHNLISSKMNQFHNHIVKADLYKVSVDTKNKSLLELACGQASDLNRWISNNFTKVLGIDYTLDNITNPRAGAYSRFLNSKMYTNNCTMLFVAGDCSKPIRTGKASDNIDTESKELLKYIFDRNKNSNKFDRIRNFPTKFDVVSCMFSVHYFFENEEKLDGFIKNVAENIAEKGKFILTFMDKDLVKKILEPDGKAIGKDHISNATVWAIIRNPDYNINTSVVYNQKINVFIENTGRLISENLVDLNILRSKLSKFNIQFVESQTFEETFKNKKTEINSIPENERTRQQKKDKNTIDTLDADENLKRFSFLNRWCIFEKR